MDLVVKKKSGGLSLSEYELGMLVLLVFPSNRILSSVSSRDGNTRDAPTEAATAP